MLANINLNLLRSLHVLLEECHVTRAAAKLNVSQSAVSRQLSQLRHLCQDDLLVRTGNVLIPTAKALALKTKLDDLLLEFDNLLADVPFDPSTYRGELVYSSSDYVAQYVFPDVAKQLTQQSPQLDMAFQLWRPELIDKLHDTGIHLASSMFTEQPEQVSSSYLGSDKLVCVMAKQHKLAQRNNLSVADLVNYSHVKVTGGGDKDSLFDKTLAAHKQTRRVALQVPFFSTAMDVLSNSDYLLVMPEHIAINLVKHWNITHKPLPLALPEQQYWLFWHPKYDNEPAHKYFRAQVLEVLKRSNYSI